MNRKFDHSIINKELIDNNKILVIELDCGHKLKVHNKKLLEKNEICCTQCITEFLSKRNADINEHFEKPLFSKISKKLK